MPRPTDEEVAAIFENAVALGQSLADQIWSASIEAHIGGRDLMASLPIACAALMVSLGDRATCLEGVERFHGALKGAIEAHFAEIAKRGH